MQAGRKEGREEGSVHTNKKKKIPLLPPASPPSPPPPVTAPTYYVQTGPSRPNPSTLQLLSTAWKEEEEERGRMSGFILISCPVRRKKRLLLLFFLHEMVVHKGWKKRLHLPSICTTYLGLKSRIASPPLSLMVRHFNGQSSVAPSSLSVSSIADL